MGNSASARYVLNKNDAQAHNQSHMTSTQTSPGHHQLSPSTSLRQLNNKYRRHKAVSEVKLDESNSELIQQNACQDLCTALRKLKTLSTLSLNLAELDVYHLNNLVFGMKHLKLSTLALDFRHNINFSVQKMEAVSQCLVNLSHSLQDLKLYFSNSFLPNRDSEITKLSYGLKHIKYLKSLDLELSECFDITKTGMQALSSSLKIHKSLSSLVLDLKGCCRSPNTGLFYLLLTLQHLTELSTFSLNLSNCHITPMEVYVLSSNLQRLNLLTTLALSFKQHKGDTAQEISNLLSGIPNLKKLSNLNLSFSSCDTQTANLFESLSSCLTNSNALSTLELDFSHCTDINDRDLQKLALGLQKHHNSLSNLTLKFNGCAKISDNGIKYLSNEIKHLRQLTSLTLDFNNCKKITNKAVQSLSSDLKSNSSLIKLSLSLNECIHVDDKAVEMLSLSIKSLKGLVNLNLRLQSCKVTDKGVHALSVNLKQNDALVLVNMSFLMCKQINRQAAEKLFDGLEHVSCLLITSCGFRKSRGGYNVSKMLETKKEVVDLNTQESEN